MNNYEALEKLFELKEKEIYFQNEKTVFKHSRTDVAIFLCRKMFNYESDNWYLKDWYINGKLARVAFLKEN